MKRNKRIRILLVLVILPLLMVFGVSLWKGKKGGEIDPQYFRGNALERAHANYSESIRESAEEYDVSYEYLMALCVLECGGRMPAGKRYEPGVYRRLKQVKEGKRSNYEQVKQRHLEFASDEAVRNLSTSWGPFQLMGYKCIGMDVTVSDIRGDDAVEFGVQWIEDEYGHLLRAGRYKDAFHYHNTGRVYPSVGGPRTHDPKYVSKGLSYMEYFKDH
ncbi:hypothetical protein [Sanyastnella coralliicola]|uniref:hypothetical protein n=1 Tax=Sanyastnella coralliicola TaxID=3069118 RepID=UPI0027B8EFBE|nr:hypothetical protein [Longitalea sp. SCSIO 12813]